MSRDEGIPGYHVLEYEHYRALFAVFASHEVVHEILESVPKAT